jgi:hypothetical protein
MAICVRPTPVPVAEPGQEAVPPGKVTGAATDKITADKNKAVAPYPLYLGIAGFAIVAGGVGGTLIRDHWAGAISFVPPQGIGIFALFYIIAQVIERVQEPLAPYLGRAKDPGEEEKEGKRIKLKNQLQAKAELENAYVAEVRSPERGNEETVANKERCVDQVRANLTVLIFGTSALLAMIISGYLKAGVLPTVGERGIPTWVDIVVTGLVIGAGTKPLHDLISNISASNEGKEKPPGVA